MTDSHPVPRPATDKQLIMDDRLAHRGGLILVLREFVAQDLSLEDIAYELRDLTKVKVTIATVQRWLDEFGIDRSREAQAS